MICIHKNMNLRFFSGGIGCLVTAHIIRLLEKGVYHLKKNSEHAEKNLDRLNIIEEGIIAERAKKPTKTKPAAITETEPAATTETEPAAPNKESPGLCPRCGKNMFKTPRGKWVCENC